jgi:hypothetical protein
VWCLTLRVYRMGVRGMGLVTINEVTVRGSGYWGMGRVAFPGDVGIRGVYFHKVVRGHLEYTNGTEHHHHQIKRAKITLYYFIFALFFPRWKEILSSARDKPSAIG